MFRTFEGSRGSPGTPRSQCELLVSEVCRATSKIVVNAGNRSGFLVSVVSSEPASRMRKR
jgi:hypothetical protein